MTAMAREFNLRFTGPFEGSLPSELGRLNSLRYIGLDGNSELTGQLPTEWGKMTALKAM